MTTDQYPICTRCLHFYLTYDYSKPYGCKAMGFKSKVSPAKVVFANSGMHCQLFTPKKTNIDNTGGSKKKYI